MMGRMASLGVAGAIGCAVGLLLAWEGVIGAPEHLAQSSAPSPSATEAAGSAGTPPDALLGAEGKHSRFALLAQKVAPGVVNVHTSRTVKQSLPEFGFPFGNLFPGMPQRPGQAPAPRSFTVPSLGTGFVISDDGLIVTNNHVIEGATEVKMLGITVPVHATIMTSDAYSAHADRAEILRWLGGFKQAPGMTYIVHGEADAASALREAITSRLGWPAAVAEDGQRVTL